MLERAWEEDKLSPFLPFPLDLWRNICTHLKNKRLISLITYFKIDIYIYSYSYNSKLYLSKVISI
jgi:hypothetical protein